MVRELSVKVPVFPLIATLRFTTSSRKMTSILNFKISAFKENTLVFDICGLFRDFQNSPVTLIRQ